jgi:hypothetical protein
MRISFKPIIFAFVLFFIFISLVSAVDSTDPFYWEPTEYGYNPYRPTPEFTPEYAKILYYQGMVWEEEISPPIFTHPVEPEDRHFQNVLWKVYTNLEYRVYKAVYFYNGTAVYTMLYYWHEQGLVIKNYYHYTPDYKAYRVFFYNPNGRLIIKETYNYNGELICITRYKENRTYEEELRGPDNASPYFWWGP